MFDTLKAMATSSEDRREYMREYQRLWLAKRRQAWIEEHGPCKCGSWENLEVDHIDPALKTMEAGRVWSRRADIREAELAKCQVLCKDCHLIKTIQEHPGPGGHGASRYDHFGCRCDVCRAAKRVANARRYPKSRSMLGSAACAGPFVGYPRTCV